MPQLKDLTINVDFVKNGKLVYRSTTWAGYVGILTAVVPKVCTVAINYRRTNSYFITNVWNALYGSWPIGFLVRHTLETENSYGTIKCYLSNSSLISPCYITISGTIAGQGIILTRSRSGVDRKDRLTSTNRDYIVQTNLDNDRRDDENVENITYSLQRLSEVDKLMQNYISMSLNNLIMFFGRWPIINDTTIYVSAICADTGEIITVK